jgi:UDP-glucuronate 4-epimerase
MADASGVRRGVVLVTGAAGFIGSHVCEALLARGEAVVGLDNFDPFYPRAFKEHNLAAVDAAARRLGGGWSFIEADVTDPSAVAAVMASHRPEGVIHLAAKAGPRVSVHDPVGYAHANVTGTAVVMHEAARAGCARLVAASSSSVYGQCALERFPEDLPCTEPVSPYAATKRAIELLGQVHRAHTKMPTAMLRFFTVFGPRQRPDLGAALFLRRIGSGQGIDMFGDGTMARDCTYIDDIVRGVLAAYDRIAAHGYRVWNLGGDRPVALSELIDTVARVVGRAPIITRKPMQAGDVMRTAADLTRSRAELGFAPSVALEEGLRRQWAWMQSLPAGLR